MINIQKSARFFVDKKMDEGLRCISQMNLYLHECKKLFFGCIKFHYILLIYGMKYLKIYESFETDIEDILLEVSDLGYTVKSILLGKSNIGLLIIAPDSKRIKYTEIEDCLLRLKDYLGDKYVGCVIFNVASNRWIDFTLSDHVFYKGWNWMNIIGIQIEYKNN